MKFNYARNHRLRPASWYSYKRIQRGVNPHPYKGGRAARNRRRKQRLWTP